MFGDILGKLISAPIRILDLPVKVIRGVVDPHDSENTIGDDIAESVERAVKDIVE